jgi:hypothetical protein
MLTCPARVFVPQPAAARARRSRSRLLTQLCDRAADDLIFVKMPLFWIVHEIDGKRRIFIQEAGALITARIKASIAGFDGEFVEAHALDAKTARKVPKKMIGRALSPREVSALLKRLS